MRQLRVPTKLRQHPAETRLFLSAGKRVFVVVTRHRLLTTPVDQQTRRGRFGPVPLSQAHPVVVEKLRTSEPGQLWAPFFLKDIWVILRLDRWIGARLDDDTRQQMLNELFDDWLQRRARQMLAGVSPDPLPLHLLR